MESEAVREIRETYEAVNDQRWDWVWENTAPEFELVPIPSSSVPGKFIGPEGVTRFFTDIAEAWGTIRTDIEEVIDLGDRVVVLGRLHQVGRGSGIELDIVAAHLWTLEDGVATRVELLGDRDEAIRRGYAESESLDQRE